jgi:hypothetical protein
MMIYVMALAIWTLGTRYSLRLRQEGIDLTKQAINTFHLILILGFMVVTIWIVILGK